MHGVILIKYLVTRLKNLEYQEEGKDSNEVKCEKYIRGYYSQFINLYNSNIKNIFDI